MHPSIDQQAATGGGAADACCSSAAAAAVVAALVVAFGSSVANSLQLALGVPIVVAGCGMAWRAAARALKPRRASGVHWIGAGLSANAALGIVVPSPDGSPLWYEIAYRAYPALALLLVGVALSGDRVWRRRAVWIAVGCATALQLVTPIAISRPVIDVWSWTDACIRAMLHGVHPYTAQVPDIYAGGYDFGYTTTQYQYMPLTLVALAPPLALFGDYRFGLALCLPLTVALIRAGAKRLAANPALVDLVTLSLVVHPRGAYLVAFGWNEPLALVALAAFVFFAARAPAGYGSAIACFLLPALRQYTVVAVLAYAIVRPRLRALAVGAGVAFLTVLPFLAWNWRATLAGMTFHVNGAIAFREDSISLTALAAAVAGVYPARWLSPVSQMLVGAAAAVWLRSAGFAGILLATALAVSISLLLAIQAFMNYYTIVIVSLLAAALMLDAGAPGEPGKKK